MEDDNNVVSLEEARQKRLNISLGSMVVTCEAKAIIITGYTFYNAWASARTLLDNPSVQVVCNDIILRRTNPEPTDVKHHQERVQNAVMETLTSRRNPKPKKSFWDWLFG